MKNIACHIFLGISVLLFVVFIILLILYFVYKKKDEYFNNSEKTSWNWKVWRVLKTKVPVQQDPYAWYQELILPKQVDTITLMTYFPRCSYFSINLYAPTLCVIHSTSGKDIKASKNPFHIDQQTLSANEKIYFSFIITKKNTKGDNVFYVPKQYKNKDLILILRYYQMWDDPNLQPSNPKISNVHYLSNLPFDLSWKHSQTIRKNFVPKTTIVDTKFFPVNVYSSQFNPDRSIPFFKYRNLPFTNIPCEYPDSCSNYLIASLSLYPIYFLKIKVPKIFIRDSFPKKVPNDLDMYYFSVSVYGYSENYQFSVNGTSLWQLRDSHGYAYVMIHPDPLSLHNLQNLAPPYDSDYYPKRYQWGKHTCIVLHNSLPSPEDPKLTPFLIIRYKDPMNTMANIINELPCDVKKNSYSLEEREKDHAESVGPPPYTYPQLSTNPQLKNHYRLKHKILTMYAGTQEEFHSGFIGPISKD